MIILLSFELQPPHSTKQDPSLAIWFNNQYFFSSKKEAIEWMKASYKESIATEKTAYESGNHLCGGITGRFMFYRMSRTANTIGSFETIDLGRNRYFKNNGEELPCKWEEYEKALLRKNGWEKISYHGPL
jgi:hypothetical protein